MNISLRPGWLQPCIFFLIAAFLLGSSCATEQKELPYKYTDPVVRVRMAAEPDMINPLLSKSIYARFVFERVFSYLMDFDPQTLELSPYLLTNRPEIVPLENGPYAGGAAYRMEIRKEAVWDDGRPVTGHDVEFSLKLIFTPGNPTAHYRPYFEFFKQVEIDPENPKRFTIYASEPYILNEAAIGAIAVYPQHFYDSENRLADYPLTALNSADATDRFGSDAAIRDFVADFTSPEHGREASGISGSGPYRFEEWVTGQYVQVSRKENWWGDAFRGESHLFDAFPEKLTFKIIPDQTAAATSLKDQEVDVSNQLDSRDFTELKADPSFTELYELYNPPSPAIYLIYLNNRDPRLADKRVRRALAHLMDVDEFITSLYNGLAERVTVPFGPWQEYYHTGLQPIPYDPEKAAQLLEEAGWTDTDQDGIRDKVIDGERIPLELPVLSTTANATKNLSLFFQNNLKKAGIDATIVTKEFRAAITDVRKQDFLVYPGAMSTDLTPDDPKQQWHTSSDRPNGSNYTGFGSPATDRLIDSLRTTLDPGLRNQLYRRLQEIIYEEQPAIFLFTPQERIAIHRRFEAQPTIKRPGFFPNSFQLKPEVQKLQDKKEEG